ncbi:hypothetical protein EON81_10275 [bacterium]|nr:MAG: hypothetical protein EON81_10275 [bacterium]
METRLRRLEIQNRLLWIALGAFVCVAAGPAVDDTLRVRRLEVIDEKGVPLVSIGPERVGDGGTVVLRDRAGEKRGWWKIEGDRASFAMTNDGTGQAKKVGTVGFGVSADRAQLSLLSQGTAQLGVEAGKPKLEMFDKAGKSVFAAPFR